MARDVNLLHPSEIRVRIYGWSSVWVTLGLFQKPNEVLVPGTSVPYVMRPTGGGGVLHGHDVTVGMSFPKEWLGLKPNSRDVRTAYLTGIRPLAKALTACGLPCALAADLLPKVGGAAKRYGDCFAGISENDVIHRQKLTKVCGCAVRMYPESVLFQASIPLTEPLVPYREVFQDAGVHLFYPWDPASLRHELEAAIRSA
jgi:lipoate-protein ligase A